MVESTYQAPNRGWLTGLVDPLKGLGSRIAEFFTPEAEASGTDNVYEIQIELPGVSDKDIDITLDDNTLVVTGEKKFEKTDQGKTYYFSERVYGRFQRSFRLPSDADPEKIDATHKDGVLSIKIAKHAAGRAGGRKIDVRRNG